MNSQSAARAPCTETSAFGLAPRELSALGLGAATFSTLQRPWTWSPEGPRLALHKHARLTPFECAPLRVLLRAASADGSVKLGLETNGSMVEAVHMPRAVRGGRVTLCVSSQVGCGMGCTFCATARMGFVRQLSAGEIVAQVLTSVHALGPRHPAALTLVFMGMGEPLHNPAAVQKAVELLCEPLGLGLSPRRITLSTSGLVPEIEALGRWPARPLLALSLNATEDSQREALMPIGRKYPLDALRSALLRYPLRPRERITFEYVLLRGVNDSTADARRLARFCAGVPHQLNLIPWNAHAGADFEAPSEEAITTFAREVLAERPTILSVRRSRAADVAGACGQLATNTGVAFLRGGQDFTGTVVAPSGLAAMQKKPKPPVIRKPPQPHQSATHFEPDARTPDDRDGNEGHQRARQAEQRSPEPAQRGAPARQR